MALVGSGNDGRKKELVAEKTSLGNPQHPHTALSSRVSHATSYIIPARPLPMPYHVCVLCHTCRAEAAVEEWAAEDGCPFLRLRRRQWLSRSPAPPSAPQKCPCRVPPPLPVNIPSDGGEGGWWGVT